MQKHRADYTNTFLALTFGKPEETAMRGIQGVRAMARTVASRVARQPEDAQAASRRLDARSNPAVIPRNHRVEEALAAAEARGFGVMERLLDVLSKPYAHAAEQADYAALPEPSARPYRTFCGT